ncbi:MAG: helix-turn-helix domain-containing protein, partial [Jatrophihabitantaceae bacterium]
VLTFDSIRPTLVASQIENYLGEQPELHDRLLADLIASDPSSARTLLGLLDTGSDVARVASQTGVHPTTVRYRLRRALASVELDLSDPDARLAAQVQLRYGLRAASKER